LSLVCRRRRRDNLNGCDR